MVYGIDAELDMDMYVQMANEHEQAARANFAQTCVICPRSMQNKIKWTKLLRKKLTGQQQFDFVLSCHAPRPLLSACLSACSSGADKFVPFALANSKKIKQFERASTSTQSATALEIAMNIYKLTTHTTHTYTYIHVYVYYFCVYNNTPILLCVCAKEQLKILKYELFPKNDAL